MAGPVGTNGQMVVAPGSLQQHRTLSFLVLVFMSCPSFPFSYFLPYFIHLLFLHLSSHVIFSLLSAPSGGAAGAEFGP